MFFYFKVNSIIFSSAVSFTLKNNAYTNILKKVVYVIFATVVVGIYTMEDKTINKQKTIKEDKQKEHTERNIFSSWNKKEV